MMRALLLFLVLAGPAQAHDFYSATCCHGNSVGGDCGPVPDAEVKFTAGGWLFIPTGDVTPFAKAQTSPDGRFHVCLPKMQRPHVRCFYAPLQGT
jgi:hypothetical protein